jgi:pyrroline-5-carboxylate reductase
MQKKFTRIGIIGTGKMAEAIISSMKKQKESPEIYALEKSAARKEYIQKKYQITFPSQAGKIMEDCNPIILAVKPQNLEESLEAVQEAWAQLSGKILISILAGKTAHEIAGRIGKNISIIRVMPNTPALIGKGIAGISFPDKFPEDDKIQITELLKGLGEFIEVNEDQMNAVTALSGSGPAYVYSFIQGLIDGGVHIGLNRDLAKKLAMETIAGTIALMKKTGREPYDLRSDVTSPGGTTIAALKVLQENAFEGIIMNAIESAFAKAHDLSQGNENNCGCHGKS